MATTIKRVLYPLIAIAAALLIALVGLLASPVQRAYADDYGLRIAGTQVTSDNAADIFGDGTASYDASTSTLTLCDFAVTGQPATGEWWWNIIEAEAYQDLTIDLEGDNAIVCGNNGESGISVSGTLTFTGNGNLYVGGGAVPADMIRSCFSAISSSGNITFDGNFTGVVVAQGPAMGSSQTTGITATHSMAVENGTVISTGGTCMDGSSYGVQIDNGELQVSGGVLVAQGGIAPSANGHVAMGISAPDNSVSVTGGVLVARGGVLLGGDGTLPDEGLASVHRRAVSSDIDLGSNTSIIGEVGYANGVFTSDVETLAGEGAIVTGVVAAPSSFSDVNSLPTALASDVCHVSTDGTSFVSDLASLNTAGHTALFVNLFETTDAATYSSLPGVTFGSGDVALSGNGKVIALGGLAISASPWANANTGTSGVSYTGGSIGILGSTNGSYGNSAFTIDGPDIIGLGGLAGSSTTGVSARSFNVLGGNLVGVGGTSGPEKGSSHGGVSAGMSYQTGDPQLSAHGVSKALGVGGMAGNNSWGLMCGYANSYDSASVMGVACANSGLRGLSEGIYDTAYAYGGTVLGVGGYSSYSAGCNSGVVAYPGGKVVGLGGEFVAESNGCSHGSSTTPYTSHAGELVIAGRTRAFSYDESQANYNFFSCADDATGYGWTDYEGTEGETEVDYSTTQGEISAFKRIVVNGDSADYPITIAGVQVTSDNAGDLTAIDGVSVADGGYARYFPSTNTIELKDATIANPETEQEVVPVFYGGDKDLAINVTGNCTLQGKDGANTRGISYGDGALTITLVDDATLHVFPGAQSSGTSSGISGSGTLTMKGDGIMDVKTPQHKDGAPSYPLDLHGDLVLADNVFLYAGGQETASAKANTAGLCLHGAQATITLRGKGGAHFSGLEAGVLTVADDPGGEAFKLNIVADGDWTEVCSFWADGSSGHAVASSDASGATITRTTETCGMKGSPDVAQTTVVGYPDKSYSFDALAGSRRIDLSAVRTVSFDANTGTGTMDPVTVPVGAAYELPACTFTPPAGYTFDGWDKGAVGAKVTVSAPMTVRAKWKKTTSTTEQKVNWKRLAGATAPDTMKLIAGQFGKAKVAIVTTDANYKDALAASALAGQNNGLVLMTKKGSLTKQTKETLKAAGVKTVFLVGSTNDVTAKVEKALKSGTGVTKVTRISGGSASAKAIAVAKKTGKRSDTVIIATQNGFQDALAIAPYSYVSKSPILYAETNKKLSNATISYIKGAKYKKAIIVGGPIALPASIETQLKKAGVTSVTRLAGTNAYRTSSIIANWTTGQLKIGSYEKYKGKNITTVKFVPAAANRLQANKLAVSTGQNWLDALAGAALCGKNKSVLLLADAKTSKSDYTLAPAWCKKNVSKMYTAKAKGTAYIFGGVKAVQPKVETALKNATKITTTNVYTIS